MRLQSYPVCFNALQLHAAHEHNKLLFVALALGISLTDVLADAQTESHWSEEDMNSSFDTLLQHSQHTNDSLSMYRCWDRGLL